MAMRNINDQRPNYDLQAVLNSGVQKQTPSQSFRKIKADDLNVDRGYQRAAGTSYINKIAREFDPALFGIITVAERDDGSYWILNGQHRVEAMRKMGNGQVELPCEVLTGKTYQEEAEIFHKRNAFTKPMSAQDKFRGRLEAGDPEAMQINLVVESRGYRINLDSSELHGGKIPGVGSLLNIDKQYKQGHLASTLDLVCATWGNDVGPRGTMIQGVAQFISFYRDRWSPKRFVSQLSRHTMEQVHRDALQHKIATGISPQAAVCATLVRRYNERLNQTNKLPTMEEIRAINMIKEAQRGN